MYPDEKEVLDENKKYDVNKVREVCISSLRKLIDAIDDNKLSDSEKIEFFDTYEEDIIEMLENKIKSVKNDLKTVSKTKIKVYVRLLNLMKDDVWYREHDFINELPLNLSLEERREELRKNRDRYFWFVRGHKSLSCVLYYCVKYRYIERRKRTSRNWEYRRIVSLKDLETKK